MIINSLATNNMHFGKFRRFSTHTPKAKTYAEAYFMKKSVLAKDYKATDCKTWDNFIYNIKKFFRN